MTQLCYLTYSDANDTAGHIHTSLANTIIGKYIQQFIMPIACLAS